MELFIKLYVILIGLAIGSFLNVLIYRIPLKISFVKGSSFCPKCNHKLKPLDLFPVFSYVFLGGKCRYCKAKISPRYPLIEILNAVCYFLVYQAYGVHFVTPLYFVVCSSLIVLTWIDFDYKIIPDRFHIIIGICALAAGFLSRDLSWADRLIGLVVVSVPVLIIAMITGGMGAGDVKLFAVCGLLLGWKLNLLVMLIASVTASIYGVALMLFQKAEKKTEIPFGPFISLGTIVCLLWGNSFIQWYVSLLR